MLGSGLGGSGGGGVGRADGDMSDLSDSKDDRGKSSDKEVFETPGPHPVRMPAGGQQPTAANSQRQAGPVRPVSRATQPGEPVSRAVGQLT